MKEKNDLNRDDMKKFDNKKLRLMIIIVSLKKKSKLIKIMIKKNHLRNQQKTI